MARETRKERVSRREREMHERLESRDRGGRDESNREREERQSESRDRATSQAIKQKEKELMAQQKKEAEAKIRMEKAQGRDKRERTVNKEQIKPVDKKDVGDVILEEAISEKEKARLATEDKEAKEREKMRKRFKRKVSLNLLSLAEEQKLG